MKKTISLFATFAILATLLISASGCFLVVGAAAGATGFAYADGELTTTIEGSPRHVIEATKLAMKDLDMPVLSSQADGLEGRLEARLGADNKATIKVRFDTQKTSKVNVRIGTFGDETKSKQIVERIKANLKNVPAPEHGSNL